HQGGMLMGTPLVKAEQHSSIRVEKLTKVGMARGRRRLAEQRLVPLETPRHIAHPDNRPCAFHRIPAVVLTRMERVGKPRQGGAGARGRRSWDDHASK